MRKRFIVAVVVASMIMAMPVCAAGPGEQIASYNQGAAATMGVWEDMGDGSWKYRMSDGAYLMNAWIESQTEAGVWFFVGADGLMMKGGNTPDGYYVNEVGEYREGQKEDQAKQDSQQYNSDGSVRKLPPSTNGNLEVHPSGETWIRG